MTPEQWEDSKGRIHEMFSVVYEGVENIPDAPGNIEILEFDTPSGSFRCEFTTKPKTLDRKVLAAARIGATAHERTVYSSSETVHHLRILQWNEGNEDWEEVKSNRII